MRLTGALFFVSEASARWGETVPDGAALAPVILPRAQHVISYHVVTRGRAFKKATGLHPAACRRRHAPPDAAQAPAARTYSG